MGLNYNDNVYRVRDILLSEIRSYQTDVKDLYEYVGGKGYDHEPITCLESHYMIIHVKETYDDLIKIRKMYRLYLLISIIGTITLFYLILVNL